MLNLSTQRYFVAHIGRTSLGATKHFDTKMKSLCRCSESRTDGRRRTHEGLRIKFIFPHYCTKLEENAQIKTSWRSIEKVWVSEGTFIGNLNWHDHGHADLAKIWRWIQNSSPTHARPASWFHDVPAHHSAKHLISKPELKLKNLNI